MKITIASSLFHDFKEFLTDKSFCIKDVEPLRGTKFVAVEINTNLPQNWVDFGIWLKEHYINDCKTILND